jgi:two-component system response regulator ResD
LASNLADTSRPVALVIEDDLRIRELLRLHLDLAGFTVDEVGDGRSALQRARATAFDLVLLDVMLPGLDGVSLCRAIRGDGPNKETPIVIVTARGDEADKVIGLESGADDYVIKPFGVRELIARIGAVMRRHKRGELGLSGAARRRVTWPDLTLDSDRRQVIVRGSSVSMTRQEFDLLYHLATRPGVVFSRAALLQNVWSGDTYVTERTIDTVISRLRRKIERNPHDPQLIVTAWGVGYKFMTGPDARCNTRNLLASA